MPRLPPLNVRDTSRADHGGKDARSGFSLDLWLQLDSLAAGQTLLDSRDATGAGVLVSTTESGTLAVTLHDGRQEVSWDCDRGAIQAGKRHHVVITVDGGPKIITFVVDGVLCDGGDQRQFGWGRFSPTLRTPSGAATLKTAPAVKSLRIYSRALRTSEAVASASVLWKRPEMLGQPARFRGRRVGLVLSGGNVDLAKLVAGALPHAAPERRSQPQ